MDYKKMWTELKEDMLIRTEMESDPTAKIEDYLLYASKILQKMVAIEVAEVRTEKDEKKELDTKVIEMLFSQKGE